MVLVFADDYREGHRLAAHFSSDLDTLCRKDYGHAYFNQVIKCLDIDDFETSCSGQNDCTMDASVGIGTYERNSVSNKRFLLVELRLGYKSPNNLDYHNMSYKILRTRDILSDAQIHPKYCFVFTPNVAPVAKNHFERKRREMGEVSSWAAMSPEELLNKIENASKQPYSPINNPQAISQELLTAYNKGENAIVEYFDYWIKQCATYQNQYNLSESRSIIQALQTTISKIKTTEQTMAGLIQLMKEDIDQRMNNICRLLAEI